MRQRILAALLLAATLPASLGAQATGPTRITAVSTGGGCSVAASCAEFAVGSAPSLTLQVTGTFVGTLAFEATSDGTNWKAVTLTDTSLTTGAIATTATAPGQFAFVNLGSLQIRVRATAFTSGSAAVTMTRGAGNRPLAVGGGVVGTDLVSDIVTRVTSAATLIPDGGGIRNLYIVTAQAVPATVAAPTGTPVDGSYLTIRLKGTIGRPLAWSPIYRGGSVPLPTAITVRTSYISFRYNAAESKWDLVSLTSNF